MFGQTMCVLLCGAVKYCSLIFKILAALVLMVLVMLIFGTIGTVDAILNDHDVKADGTNSTSFDHVVEIVRDSYATGTFPDVFIHWAIISGVVYFFLLIVYVVVVLFNIHRKCASSLEESADNFLKKRHQRNRFVSMRHENLETDEQSMDTLYSNYEDTHINDNAHSMRDQQRQFFEWKRNQDRYSSADGYAM